MQIALNNRLLNTNHVRQFSRTGYLAAVKRDFYAELRVPRNAIQSDIKNAYKGLSQLYQSEIDNGSKDAADKLKRLNQAYHVLSHIDQKRLYDKGMKTSPNLTRMLICEHFLNVTLTFRFVGLTSFSKGVTEAITVTAEDKRNQSYPAPQEHDPIEYAKNELNDYLSKHIGVKPLNEWRVEASEKASVVERVSTTRDLKTVEYMLYVAFGFAFVAWLWTVYEKETYLNQSKK